MKENETVHTFIVTADAASIRHAQLSPIALAQMQAALFINGMKAEDRKKADAGGLYYSKKISF